MTAPVVNVTVNTVGQYVVTDCPNCGRQHGLPPLEGLRDLPCGGQAVIQVKPTRPGANIPVVVGQAERPVVRVK